MCDKRTHCTFAEMIKQNNKIQYPSYLKSAFIRHTLTDWMESEFIFHHPTSNMQRERRHNVEKCDNSKRGAQKRDIQAILSIFISTLQMQKLFACGKAV